MKSKKQGFFTKTPVTKFLKILFISFFLVFFTSKLIEHKKLRRTKTALNELETKTIRRQQILTSFLQNSNYIRIHALNLFLGKGKNKNHEEENRINELILRDDENELEYQKLIEDPYEQRLFNRVRALRKAKLEKGKNLIQLMNRDNNEIALNIEEYLPLLYENSPEANTTLEEFVHRRDASKIKNAEIQFKEIEKTNILLNIILIFGLSGLAFIIARTIKVMKVKTSEIEESENKYRKLTEHTNEIIQKFDANGNLVFANESFRKKLGYDDDELYKLTVSDILGDGIEILNEPHPEPEEIITNVQKVLKNKTGENIYIEGTVFLEYRNAKFIGSMGFFNDVTEKKQLETFLIASEERFRQLFKLAPIPMWLYHQQTYRITQVNNMAVRHYGYSEAEFLNKTILEIRPKESELKFGQHLANLRNKSIEKVQKEMSFSGNFEHLKKSGEIINVEIYTTPITVGSNSETLVIALDVTERRQLENKITKAIIKTQEEDQYEIGSELHDNICQILASATMSLGMLKASLPASLTDLCNKSREFVVLASTEIRNLSHRLAPAFFNNTSLKEVIKNLLTTFNIENKYKIALYFDDEINELPLRCDIQLNLYRIFQEQLRNIFKYANGTLIEIDLLLYNQFLKVRIADDGVGFNINEIKKGIGLANMKRRTELFSGKIKINSSPGNGCEMLISFPLNVLT